MTQAFSEEFKTTTEAVPYVLSFSENDKIENMAQRKHSPLKCQYLILYHVQNYCSNIAIIKTIAIAMVKFSIVSI